VKAITERFGTFRDLKAPGARQFTKEERSAILAETLVEGATVAAVARKIMASRLGLYRLSAMTGRMKALPRTSRTRGEASHPGKPRSYPRGGGCAFALTIPARIIAMVFRTFDLGR
jgi:hypothetical protein